MVDNSTIAGIGMGAAAGGGILGAFGALTSGVANKNMDNYQSGVARLNQQIAQQNAEFATQTGEQQALQSGLKSRQQAGQIKVAQASSGFDVRSGSNLQVQASQQKLAGLDQSIIRSNAAKTAYNYQEQASVAGAQAQVYSAAGANAMEAGAIGAGSSILGGASSVSSMWLQGQRVGMWGNPGGSNSGALGS
jgi:hypothetical protein